MENLWDKVMSKCMERANGLLDKKEAPAEEGQEPVELGPGMLIVLNIEVMRGVNKMTQDKFPTMVKDGKDLFKIIQSVPEDKRPMLSALAGAFIDGIRYPVPRAIVPVLLHCGLHSRPRLFAGQTVEGQPGAVHEGGDAAEGGVHLGVIHRLCLRSVPRAPCALPRPGGYILAGFDQRRRRGFSAPALSGDGR